MRALASSITLNSEMTVALRSGNRLLSDRNDRNTLGPAAPMMTKPGRKASKEPLLSEKANSSVPSSSSAHPSTLDTRGPKRSSTYPEGQNTRAKADEAAMKMDVNLRLRAGHSALPTAPHSSEYCPCAIITLCTA